MISEKLLQLDQIKLSDRVGIMLSGGMDSALLLYLLVTNLDNEISPFTVPKTDGAANYVGPIVNWINQRVGGKVKQPKLIGNPLLPHIQIINTAIRSIELEYDILYFAGNSYPETILPNGPQRVRRTNPKHCQPFFDCYKTDIVQAYVDYDLMELIPLTHTCTEWAVGRCNSCWQCRERDWAFKKLQLIDDTTT